jgi:hypothetical protein
LRSDAACRRGWSRTQYLLTSTRPSSPPRRRSRPGASGQRTDTTAALGHWTRTVSVNQVVYLLFRAIASADLVGAIVVVSR